MCGIYMIEKYRYGYNSVLGSESQQVVLMHFLRVRICKALKILKFPRCRSENPLKKCICDNVFFCSMMCIMNSKAVLQYYKYEGETLAELLLRVRKEQDIADTVPLTYAGRLDPMAEGVVLVLTGEECKKKDEYLGMDKTYEYEVLFGVETDTFDILGMPKIKKTFFENDFLGDLINANTIQTVLKNFMGKIKQTYPPYSSKTVDGVPLFQYAREGNLGAIELPTNEVEIYYHEFLGLRTVSRDELLSQVEERIKKVKGDFRQDEILKAWFATRTTLPETLFIASFRISCSSGTYIRRIASDMGTILGASSLAWKIKRTKIGK